MPYITQDRKTAITFGDMPETAGELNYEFTLVAKEYLDRKGISYQHINDVLGALEGAKQEFYRRVAVPYENNKIAVNGDVF